MSLQSVIEKKTKCLEDSLKAKDFLAASKFYTENSTLMPSTGDTFIGRDEIIKFAKLAYSNGNPEVISKVLEVVKDGNLVVSRGSYKVCDGSKELGCGNFVHVWKEVNNDYQMHMDIWNETRKA